ncbi:sigma-54-dependent transcriptional regulator [Elongatibacter sediminis]|uniref:Sigma-54 dependent transcriptional regulator n=1 Tax=Elongatibacter sediminis TaxID=3119006 RepID=A0AAW9RBH7_9GAMM
MPNALVIDDQTESLLQLSEVFSDAGFHVETASDLKTARDRLLKQLPEIAIINLQVGDDESEEEAFRVFGRADLGQVMEIYLVSDSTDHHRAARGMQIGASDFFERPVDLERLRANLDRFLAEMESDPDPDSDANVHKSGRGLLKGESPAMQRVYRLVRKVAPTEVTVLVVGESGCGKELISRSIHELSNRADGPFVAMNCGAISGELIESELFGHTKGAFTGAHAAHTGFFERARGGTLLLDEITEMDLELQVKLLRVLETRTIRRVGGEKDIEIDVRLIAATNRDPEEAIAEGALREDLYYRLAEFPMRVPPLRERGDDIVLLAEFFLAEQVERNGIDKALSDEVKELLRLHQWPGNVRELKNAVARAYIIAGPEIVADDLPGSVPAGGALSGDYVRIPVGSPLEVAERRVILATLEHFENDKPRAADALGISLKTLYNRLKKYQRRESAD